MKYLRTVSQEGLNRRRREGREHQGLIWWQGAVVVGAILLICNLGGCKPTEEKAEKAKQEVIKNLLLPPDTGPNPKSQVSLEKDYLMLSFGTNQSLGEVRDFYKSELEKRKLKVISESDNGISYMDEDKHQISITWFARDPDLSEFATVFHVLVQPLPKPIRSFEEEKLKAK